MMTVPSILFEWQGVPNAILKDDLITLKGENYIYPSYHPVEHTTDILNALRLVFSESDALNFIQRWGFLRHKAHGSELLNPIEYKEKIRELNYITQYIFHTNKLTELLSEEYLVGIGYKREYSRDFKDENKRDYQKIKNEVAENLNLVYSPQVTYQREYIGDEVAIPLVFTYFEVPNQTEMEDATEITAIEVWGEKVSEIINFAQDIRAFSTVIRLTEKYANANKGDEEYHKVDQEMNEWLSTNPDIFPFNKSKYISILKSGRINTETGEILPFNEEALQIALEAGRIWVSSELEKGSYLRIDSNSGQPLLYFDNLRNFILYSFIADPAPIPNRCHDPKCNQLFFPSRKGQRYCPPFPWEKRSRCEQRHGKALRREAKRKTEKINPRF